MLKLAHGLRKRSTLFSNEVSLWHANIGVEDFTEMTVGRHVCNGPHFNARCIHRHDDFTDTSMWWSVVACAADEIAVVSIGTKTGPNLLSVDDPLVTVVCSKSFQRCKVATGIRFAHANAPRCFTSQDARQEFFLLLRSSVLNECRTHLTVTKPTCGDWRTSLDHLFTNDETFNRRASATTELSRPNETDPTVRRKFARELFRVSVHPRCSIASVSGYAICCNGCCLLAQGNVFGAPLKIH